MIIDPIDDPILAQDIQSLDAQIINGQLIIDFTLASLISNNIEFFLDTDRNPTTGDIRVGHIGNAEYRISALVLNGFLADYQLYQLPRNDAEVLTFLNLSGNGGSSERFVTGGNISIRGNSLRISLPLAAIGNTNAVDVFAIAYQNNPFMVSGNGDRASNVGAIDTATRQVVVRRSNVLPISSTVSDPRGDSGNAPDLVSANFNTIGDQFRITLNFAQPIDTGFLSNFSGEIVLDSDRSLLTGGIFMGGEIPTWGGDIRLRFDFLAGGSSFLLQADNSGNSVLFGGDRNDGRWLVQGKSLILESSLSVFDAFSFVNGNSRRIFTDGGMYASISLFDNPLIPSEWLPQSSYVVDTRTGQILSPLTWNPAQTISESDPQEFGFGISGIDLFRVDTQVIENKLVVKGFLTTWSSTDTDNLFEILLDTDMNATTGERVFNPTAPGQPVIGADSKVYIASFDGIAPVYTAILEKPNGERQPHEAWLRVQTSDNAAQPGSFTVTIPLEALGNLGSKLRFFVTTGQNLGAGRLDIAPNSPIEINLENKANIGTPGNDHLQGTSNNDTLDGLAGNDTLDGLAGNDRLTGGTGNDSLVGGTGIDTVVETRNSNFSLTNTRLTDNDTDTLSSIERANLTGGAGNNILNAAAFTLGAVTLKGGAGNDTLTGGTRNDNLIGGVGNDSLTGGLGADRFTFNNRTEGIDQITDFLSSQGDKIAVSASRFGGGLAAGVALTSAQFTLGSAATTASTRFIYDPTNGNLFFDRDGTGTSDANQIATLSTKPGLDFMDIIVIA